MSQELLETLKRVRFVLFGDESGPGPNAPCIGDTLWADSACTLQDYIDNAIDRASTMPLPLDGGVLHTDLDRYDEHDAAAYRIERAECPIRSATAERPEEPR